MKNNILLITLFLFTICCKKAENQTLISGNIPNLPDGTLYLYEESGTNRIDSVQTDKGTFELSHDWTEKEPVYIGIDHVDNNGVLRFFSFRTNAKYRGAGWGTSVFLSDSIISINGNLKYDDLVGIQLPPDKKSVTGPPLKAGKQTEAFYHIDGDLFENINSKTVSIIREKLTQYPSSYHLLYKINENKNSFSGTQVADFLKAFKGEIIQSKTYQTLKAYNDKRLNNSGLKLPLLEDSEAGKKQIVDKKYRKHLIIFWASWCGPCRQEIPLLKKIHADYQKEMEFVSISIDDDKKAWQKAVRMEKMQWKQLIVDKKNISAYESLQIHFKLNQAIPYTVLVDENMKILASFTGLSNENELKKSLEK